MCYFTDNSTFQILSFCVVATHSGKQTHSEGQCRQWSAVYYTGGPKAESPLSQGPRPAFVKIFYTPCVCVRTHHPKFLETYINKGRVNTIPITPSLMCHVFRQLNNQPIINKREVILQQVQKIYGLSGGRGGQCMCYLRREVTWIRSSRFPCLEGVLSFCCRFHRH